MEVFKNTLAKTINCVAGISVAVIFVVVFAQVISRYVFQFSIPWSTDVIRIAFIYSIFFGATIGMREKGHLCVDLLMTILPKRSKALLGIFINCVLIAFLLFIGYYGIQFTIGAVVQRMPYLEVPMSIMYIAIPLNAMLMVFYLCLHIYEQLQEFRIPKMR